MEEPEEGPRRKHGRSEAQERPGEEGEEEQALLAQSVGSAPLALLAGRLPSRRKRVKGKLAEGCRAGG